MTFYRVFFKKFFVTHAPHTNTPYSILNEEFCEKATEKVGAAAGVRRYKKDNAFLFISGIALIVSLFDFFHYRLTPLGRQLFYAEFLLY